MMKANLNLTVRLSDNPEIKKIGVMPAHLSNYSMHTIWVDVKGNDKRPYVVITDKNGQYRRHYLTTDEQTLRKGELHEP